MKILIAEDDRHTAAALKEILEAEGYAVRVAHSGPAALTLFREEKPDLVCLDIMMPGKDGYEVCRAIRASDRRVPILFVSARGEEIDKVVGLELGADDYIVKPFGVREIVARIKALLRRSASDDEAGGVAEGAAAEADFAMDGLSVRPGERRAYAGTVAIELTEKELRILSLLHREQGRVVSRKRLYSEAWDMDYLDSSRALDQQLLVLRKKVEPAGVVIQTVRGTGYRWEPGSAS